MFATWMFALGLVIVPAFSEFVPFYLLLVSAAALWLLGHRLHRSVHLAFCFVLGLLISSWQIYLLCERQLPRELDGTRRNLTFKIVDIPQQRERSVVFVAEVESTQCGTRYCAELLGRRIRLSWYYPEQALAAGQVWSASVKLRRPRGLANPGGFDYQAWLLGQGLVASGYVHSQWQLQRVESSWASTRSSVANRVERAAEGGYSRFWPALLIADRSQITASDWQTLQVTGTIHLVAISGLHIGLVSLWAFWLGRGLARLWCLLANRGEAAVMHCTAPLLSSCAAILYTALAGFSIPTLRACVACLVINICALLGLRIAPMTLLGLGVVIVALGEPLAWQNNGFWLSFAAVFLLIHTFAGRLSKKSLLSGMRMQLVLSFGLSVPLVWLGQGVSWVSPLANLLAVPVVSFIIVPGLLIATLMSGVSIGMTQLLLQGLDWVFGSLWQYLVWLQSAPSALLWFPKAHMPLAFVIALLGVLLVLSPVGIRARGLGVIALLLAASVQSTHKPPLRMTVMDVGQGLSVVLQTPNSTWVYDTGPAFSANFDAGSRILVPYLRSQGVQQVNAIVSHADNDHSGGTAALLAELEVQSLRVGEPLMLPNVDSAMTVPCHQGQSWHDDGLKMKALWPPAHANLEGNAASCVVLVQLQLGRSAGALAEPESGARQTVNILLTGDIDRAVERQIVDLIPAPIDFVIAPHHGSKSSSSEAFIRAMEPKAVIFSAGYSNRYGHPHPQVVARYQTAGARSYNTATSGAIVVEWPADGGGPVVSQTRLAQKKLWYP